MPPETPILSVAGLESRTLIEEDVAVVACSGWLEIEPAAHLKHHVKALMPREKRSMLE
jgi:hypothetical protein